MKMTEAELRRQQDWERFFASLRPEPETVKETVKQDDEFECWPDAEEIPQGNSVLAAMLVVIAVVCVVWLLATG